MTNVALSVAKKLAPLACRDCGYLIFSNHNVRQLKDALEKLDRASQRVQHFIEEARRDMKPIAADVQKWMKEVETVANEARDLLEYHDATGNKTCFCGWLPNPIAHYRLDKKASRMVKDITELIRRGQFQRVYFENPRPGLVMVGAITDSRASVFRDIMKALEDENVKVIGIYGPAGVGKTKLLREIEKKIREKKRLFKFTAKSEVSQTPDLKKIQDNIAHYLSADLKDVTGEHGRRDLLYKRLQNDEVLIILDDLWTELDLEAVGIPLGDESSKCKLLLTSRFKDVLTDMKCTPSTSIFHLQCLKDDEALRLFEEKVGDRLKNDEDVRAIAPEVVKKLAGLPLLINSVATTLKDSDLSAWRIALKKIDVRKMETIVKLSYDRLSEDEKTLFRVCGLFGGTITLELLLGLGMGLGLFEELNNTIEDARDKLSTMVNSLRSVCLLEDGGDDKEEVTIHDLYSEVVVSTQLGAQESLVMNSNYGWWPKKKLEKCWAIRLADVGRDRLAETLTCQFPELKILMLSQQRGWRWMPERHDGARDCCGPLDFKNMKELRVLCLCSMHIAPLPSSMKFLKNLQSLYLDDCDVEDVAILGELEALEILSFAGSTISTLPKEIGGLTRLRSLNLTFCFKLEIIERGALKGLFNLEELSMKGSFDRWMGEDKMPSESCNARLAELKSLTKLTALEISIPDPAILLEDGDLPFGNLVKFWINIGDAHEREFKSSRTMMLDLGGRECDSILSKEWVQKTLSMTQYLHLKGLSESKESTQELCIRRCLQLKHLVIENSPLIKYIAHSSALMSLESLHLENLNNLVEICHGPLDVECFGKLKAVTISKCNRLKNIWCLPDKIRLGNLEEGIVELPNMRHLKLYKLPDMTSFCIGDNGASVKVSFPCLESLVMEGLDKICHGPECFSKLKALTIQDCPQLKSLRCHSDMQGPIHLEEIYVKRCNSMQAIITYDARNVEIAADDIDNLANVRCLKLWELPNMTSFCIHDDGTPIQVSFPRLKTLMMFALPKLEKICHGLDKPECFSKLKALIVGRCSQLKNLLCLSDKQRLVHLEKIYILQCDSMQAIIRYDARNVETTADSIVELPNVRHLTLERLPNMTSFCIDTDNAPKQVSLPCLEKLELGPIGSLQKIWYSELSKSSFYKLAFLSLYDCPDIVNFFPSTIVEGLRNLKEFSVVNCPSLESLVECGSLDSNTKQMMSFPSLRSLWIWKCPNIGAFIRSPTSAKRSSAQSLFNEMITFPNIRELKIEGIRCKELWNNQIPEDSFCKLESLRLENCDKLQHIASFSTWKRLQCCLEILHVISCPLIEVIYEGDETDIKSSRLRTLAMRDLDGLKHMWRSDGQPNVPFPNLRKVGAVRCSRLEVLFASFTEKFLGRMEELVVESCEDMKLIAGREEGEGAISREITFKKLTALGLLELPQFRSLLPEEYFPNFPSLKVLNRKNCGNEPDQNLGDWEDYEIWGNTPPATEREFSPWK